ncbi:MAG TPA: hypothetical protein VML96_12085 [Egibacteraceae bacterium]|nr:hypothetical protein [Egibacteraceae bacterium]
MIAALAAAAVGLGMTAEQDPKPAATSDATPTPAPSAPATTAPPATPTPTLTPTPTATALPALVGSVRVSDPAGDVTDPAGQPPPEPEPAADLLAVGLEGDGQALEVQFELSGPLPPSARTLLWSVELYVGGELAYTVTIQQLDSQLFTGVYDWESGEQTTLGEPVIAEGEISVSVPATLLPRVDGPLTWSALGQQDESYEDFLPDDPTGDRAAFPS